MNKLKNFSCFKFKHWNQTFYQTINLIFFHLHSSKDKIKIKIRMFNPDNSKELKMEDTPSYENSNKKNMLLRPHEPHYLDSHGPRPRSMAAALGPEIALI